MTSRRTLNTTNNYNVNVIWFITAFAHKGNDNDITLRLPVAMTCNATAICDSHLPSRKASSPFGQYCLLTHTRVCVNNLPSQYVKWNSSELYPGPLDCKTDLLTTIPATTPRYKVYKVLKILVNRYCQMNERYVDKKLPSVQDTVTEQIYN